MSRQRKDHIPDWAGGRIAPESLTGRDRLYQIVRDAEMTGSELFDRPAFLTVKQARELWNALQGAATKDGDA